MQTVHLVHYTTRPGGLEIKMPLRISGIKNYKVKVFIIRDKSWENVYRETSVEIAYGSNIKIIAFIKFFLYVLKQRKDIFHLFNAGPFFLAVLSLLGAKRVVYSIHGTIYWRSSFQRIVRKIFWGLGLSKYTVLTSNSEYSAKIFKERIAPDSSPVLLYNPIDLGRFSKPDGKITGKTIKVVYAGRLVEGKNLDRWVDAAVFLLKKELDAVFEIYGNGSYKSELQRRINESGYNEKIILKGHESHIENVFRSSDLLLFLSEYESFGNVAVESVLCGTPVITFNIPPMLEIFKNYPEFIIKNEKGFESELYGRIKTMAHLRMQAAKASKEFADRFGADIYKRKLEEIYVKLN